MNSPEFVIFLNGSYGVGKTSTLNHIGDLMVEALKPFSLMDADWFHRSWPPAAHDPANVVIEAVNMAAVWRNYKSTGPRQLIVSGVISSPQDCARYEAAFELPVRPVRLIAEERDIESRLRRRYTQEQDASLLWHLDRYRELQSRLAQADLDENIIETSGCGPRDVAAKVLEHFSITKP
ncbi:hypothetical protein HP499_18380 [Paenarthrobacter sp. CM16]|uniref:hypothetical protein n=1 Tax=Paenarthrobacter sp. CM16 TaxID=2738447 RepID=UPI001553B0D2|nr:hypothetical protein [Paenarthrobacter sp. CM16]NQD89754.1 hypothetical protein [Paenarthrobacter sp. CM16]